MAFLKAEWRKLAIANYAVDPSVLNSLLPPKTKLDLRNGKCYLSLVGFMFLNTRVKGIRIPFHRNFEEINLRFYVTYETPENEIRRGVVFIREIVSKPLLAFVANTVYNEHYFTMKTAHEWKISGNELSVEYKWKKDPDASGWNSFRVIAENSPIEIPAGSEEEFITEHYWGYTKDRSGNTSEYAVHHPRWKIYPVKEFSINVDFGKVYGNEFSFLNNLKPDSVMLAEGSEISVMEGRKI